ncbi:MAG: hypothetical protein ABIW50_05555 [Candidatus Limnocylindria bacterium]
MSRSTFESLRAPVAVVLVVIAAVVLWPRGSDPSAAAAGVSPTPSVVVGEPGGEVIAATPTPLPPIPAPTLTPAPTPTATPVPTPAPVADGFSAEVLACRSISGSECNDRLDRMPPNAATFTALVRFTDARAGDVINVVLAGPNGSTPGGAFTLQGGGDGYYYSTFQARGLPAGDYILTATRNGAQVATTSLTRRRG